MVVVLVCLFAPSVASAAVPANDNFGNATPLPLFTILSVPAVDMEDATVQGGEPLTPGNGFCNDNEARVDHTVWYRISLTAGEAVTFNTFGSDFDTVMVVYNTDGTGAPTTSSGPPSFDNAMFCDDDAGVGPGSRLTVANPPRTGNYLIQVGAFTDGTDPGVPDRLRILASDSSPTNDDRADATVLTAGTPLLVDNIGAFEEANENISCQVDPNTSRLFGSTVWFRFEAPAKGTLTLTSTEIDTVMQLYRGNETTPLACNDDGQSGPGPSRIQFEVTAGTYLVQVGGFFGVQGNVTMSAEFTPDTDLDDDGVPAGADCDDNDPNRRPGATDVPDNGADEDCSGADAVNLDRDGDGIPRPQDCDDANAGRRPGATDVPDNGVDEDCSGADSVNLDRDGDGVARPTDCNDNNPNVRPGVRDIPGNGVDEDCRRGDARLVALTWRYNYFINPRGKVTNLTVSAPRGARVRVSCSGNGCPKAKNYNSRGRTIRINGIFKKSLGNGATITLRATMDGFIGRIARITNRRGKAPRNVANCLQPGSNRPSRCPR